MATTTAVGAAPRRDQKLNTYIWEGVDRNNKTVRGEVKAVSEAVVSSSLRRQGIRVVKLKRQRFRGGGKVSDKDVTMFTRQLATMMRAGVPLLQSFDIVARGNSNPRFSRLLLDIKGQLEAGASLSQAFRKYPLLFDQLYCNLVAAGEASGTLDAILERLATYKEKILALKGKIKSAMFYPISVMLVAVAVVFVIMVWVIPSFKQVFANFGAELPGLTLIVIAISDFFVEWWWIILGAAVGAIYAFWVAWRTSKPFRYFADRTVLKLPVLGEVLQKAAIARWTRTLQTMFAAGVPLVESLDAVAGAAGNQIYADATKKIQADVATGTALAVSMASTGVFPNMVLQMTQIGEESGALDTMLGKVADFYEREVDDAVAALASLIEPVIIVFLGVVIGGLVVAMYLPIFKLGAVI